MAQQQSSAVQNLVDAQNAAMANPNYAPNTPTAGTTHCNGAACSIDRTTGGDPTGVFANAKGVPYDANTQINNLANPKSGYQVVTPAEAQALADNGGKAWATQLGAKHGHIASVRPEGVPGDQPRGRSGPRIALLPNVPIGWNISVDNDPSWNTVIKGSIDVGAAAMDPDFLRDFLVVEMEKDAPSDAHFDLQGEVIVTSDFIKERRIKLSMKDFATKGAGSTKATDGH